jgi:hypothetical protein
MGELVHKFNMYIHVLNLNYVFPADLIKPTVLEIYNEGFS